MSQAKRIIVIGGSAAGPKAAARARRMDEYAEITIIRRTPIFLWHHAAIHIMWADF